MTTTSTTEARYSVIATGPDGVHTKDIISGHWTTYATPLLTLQEAEKILAHAQAQPVVTTYRIIDAITDREKATVRGAAVRQYLEQIGYHDMPWPERGQDPAIRAKVREIGDAAVLAAGYTL